MRLNCRGAVSWPLPHSGHSVRRAPQCRQASPAGIVNLLPLVASQKCVHGISSIWSARKRRLHSRQSTIGSVKLSTWPLAFHTVGVHQDGRVEPDHVVALLDEVAPPHALDVVLQLHAERTVVPAGAGAAVDLARLEDEAPPLAQRDDHVHRCLMRVLPKISSSRCSSRRKRPLRVGWPMSRDSWVSSTRAQLRPRPPDRRGHRFLPAQRSAAARTPPRSPATPARASAPARAARLADDPALAEGRPRKRIGAAALDAAVEPRPMAEHVQAAHAEADRHAGRPGRRPPSRAAHAPAARRARAGDRARRSSGPRSPRPRRPRPAASRSSRSARERMRHVEVVDADQVAAPGVEEHELAEREQLERAAEAGPHRGARPARRRAPGRSRARRSVTTRSLSPSGKLPMTTAAERPRPSQDVSRKPNSRSARVVLPPVAPHLHVELEEHLDAEERLELTPGRRCRSA